MCLSPRDPSRGTFNCCQSDFECPAQVKSIPTQARFDRLIFCRGTAGLDCTSGQLSRAVSITDRHGMKVWLCLKITDGTPARWPLRLGRGVCRMASAHLDLIKKLRQRHNPDMIPESLRTPAPLKPSAFPSQSSRGLDQQDQANHAS